MRKFWDRMKLHWGISNNFQVLLILLVFALTGFSTLYAHNGIDYILGVEEHHHFLVKLAVFLILVMPIYTVLLYSWAVVLGQRVFFTKFIKIKLKLITGKGFR